MASTPTFDQPPQCPAPPVPKQSTAYAPPTPKMTSSAPACMAVAPCSAPVSLPAPMPSWQTGCIQQPVPITQLEEFLAQVVEQNSPPEEQSTLVQAVARYVDSVQQAEHIRDRTWHRQEVEQRRRMAQPGWKTAMESQQQIACESSATCDGRPTSLPPTTNHRGRNASFDRYPGSRGTVFKFCVCSTTACSILCVHVGRVV